MTRKIYPVVLAATEDGVQRLSDEQTGELVDKLMASRTVRPDGPGAPLA
jgi:proteasome beta subunit